MLQFSFGSHFKLYNLQNIYFRQNFIDFTFISDEAAILSCHPMMSKLMGEPEGSTRYRNKKLSVGECFIQGWCNSLMNAHKYLVSMQEDPNASFFGIYDGYGGDAVARYSSKYLHKLVVQQPEYKNNDFEKALKQVSEQLCGSSIKQKIRMICRAQSRKYSLHKLSSVGMSNTSNNSS